MHQVYDSDRLRVKYQIPELLSFKNQQPQWKKGFLGSLSSCSREQARKMKNITLTLRNICI